MPLARLGKGADFNPRSPCGERLAKCVANFTLAIFQSTLPLRGATIDYANQEGVTLISIHAPLAGSDKKFPQEIKHLT